MRSSQEKEDEIKKTDVDDAQWSRSRTYPILRSPKRQGKLFAPLQWSAARIVEQVVKRSPVSREPRVQVHPNQKSFK